ncbi:hypothetical protein RFI_35306 [Reticulomyxa filosa]|uniref:Uncharacterized protein n=1 Tax=Reticulomyxa filosa TaxID=46433 RepID=X6LKH8_RETFI|nr:hypothetical protein RFI_35306 [Reticulomyxa filosa]|eukprot:ETO02129.1 hypothetical protein RFI_35306 [Reticulomyxa filosa]
MKIDMERIRPEKEYLGMDQRPPPFEYDSDHPPLPLQKDQLQRGDTICVYHPIYCFWHVNYMFVELDDQHKILMFSSLDPRLPDEHKKLHIPYEESWPVIYRYTKAVKENAKLSEPQVVNSKLEISAKPLNKIDWKGVNPKIREQLHLYWHAHKNSFLRCLNLATKYIDEQWSYENLTLISGVGTFFRWKEAFGDKYVQKGDIDEEIQLIERVSLLKIDQVWIEEWKNKQNNTNPLPQEELKQQHIYSLESRAVESLEKSALVLTHDSNGNFGILCGYRALKDIEYDMKFLEKPAQYVFLLKRFVINEEFADQNSERTWDHLSIASLRYVVFISKKSSDLLLKGQVSEAKIKPALLKEALECAIQLYHGCKDKEADAQLQSDKDKEKKTGTTSSTSIQNESTSSTISNGKDSSKCETDTSTKEKTTEQQTASFFCFFFLKDHIPELLNPEVEGKSGFERWISHLSNEEDPEEFLCKKSLYCLMMLFDARQALLSCFSKLEPEFKHELTLKLDPKLGSLREAMTEAMNILKEQTNSILNLTEFNTILEAFDGNFESYEDNRLQQKLRKVKRDSLIVIKRLLPTFPKKYYMIFEIINNVYAFLFLRLFILLLLPSGHCCRKEELHINCGSSKEK